MPLRSVRWLRIVARIRRSLWLGWRATGHGVVEFTRSDNLTFAASIAYYSLLSLFPLLVILLTVVDAVVPGPRGEVLRVLVENLLPGNLDYLAGQIEGFRPPLQVSVVGMGVALWASMGVFGAITSAVNHAWGVDEPPGFLRHKLIAFVMLMAAGLLFASAVALVSAVQVVESSWFADVLQRFPGWNALQGLAYRYAPTPMFILVLGLIYYYVPTAKVRLRDVWFGAVLAGLLWRMAFEAFSYYYRGASRFSVEGSVASIIVALVWIYLSAVILLYGVEVTAAYARLRQRIPADEPAAEALR